MTLIHWLPRCAALFLALSVCLHTNAQTTHAHLFDLPADLAENTLKLFSEQSGSGLIVSTAMVKDIHTNAVQGEFTEREALRLMLEGTGLESAQDVPSGAFTVRPAKADPETAPPQKNLPKSVVTQEHPRSGGSGFSGEDTVQLDPYEVEETKDTGIVNQGVIPREVNQALRYEILDRAAIERSGAPSLPELFRQVSSVANFGTGTQATYGSQMASLEGISTTSDEINLRGLGSNNTLVMINGRRIYDSENAGADISRIPLASVERIEILPGSGSAIYGAGATAGVVNIILRKNYSGTELSTSVGSSTKGGGEEVRATLYHGNTFNDGKTNLTVSLDYQKQWEMLASERGYYEEALRKVDPSDTSNYIRTIIQNFFEQRGTVTAGGALNIPSDPAARFAAVPVGSDGVGLTRASFNDTAGIASVSSARVGRAPLIPEIARYNFNATIEHAIRGDDLGVYVNTSYGYVDRGTQKYVGVLGALTMSAATPNNPFGRSVQVYMEPTDLPWTTSTATQQSFNVVGGAKGQGTFLNRDFKWSVDASWSRNESSATNVDYTRLVRAAISAGLYNPLRDLTDVPQMTADQAKNYYSQFRRNSTPEVVATNWRANGGLFDAWGGEARFSVGAELRLENQFIEALWDYGAYKDLVGSGARPSSTVKTYRRAQAVYGEMTLPIVGPQNRRPMIYALDLSAAIRYEQYDDFGSAAPPMIAARYAPSEDIMLRGSWSSGFQPPLQNQLFNPQTLSGPWTYLLFTDTLRPGLPIQPYTSLSGGNPDLSPETSDSYDLGLVLTPRAVPGLTLSASYFRYDKRDLVRTVSRQDAIDFPDLFPGRVTRDPASAADIAAGRPGPITQFDLSYTNISRQLVDGWDFSGTYAMPTENLGTFTLRGDATYTMSFREQLRPGLDFVNTVGDLGFSESVPLVWRGKVGVQWNTQRWNANLTGRYVDSYVGRTNNPTAEVPSRLGLDGDKIPSSFEVDLQIGYSFPYKTDPSGTNRWLDGCQITLAILNIADRAPPLRTERINQWYSLFNDPRQRYVTLSIKKPL